MPQPGAWADPPDLERIARRFLWEMECEGGRWITCSGCLRSIAGWQVAGYGDGYRWCRPCAEQLDLRRVFYVKVA
jgi:hypothetical protein